MPSVLSANFVKRGGDVSVDTATWVDSYKVVCEPGVTQAAVVTYMRSTKGVAPGLMGDAGMFCSTLRVASSVADGQLWTADATYTRVRHTYTTGSSLTPLSEPWAIRFSKTPLSQVLTKAYAKWIDGASVPTPSTTPAERILNTAGDPFDPPLMQDINLTVIDMEKNVTTSAYSSVLSANIDDTVNSANITVAGKAIPKWGARLSVEGTRAYYVDPSSGSNVMYYRMKCVVTIHPLTWIRFVLNTGLRGKISGGDGKLVRAMEAGYADKRSDAAVKLDATGCFLTEEGEDVGVWVALLSYLPKTWSSVDLPTALTTE